MMSKSAAQLNDAAAFAEAEKLERKDRHEEARQIRREIADRRERDANRDMRDPRDSK